MPERVLVLLLALAAGLRVLLFALAFPFFANVDEIQHFDAALKYSQGRWPSPALVPYEGESVRLLGRFGSPEYQRDPVAPLRPELPAPTWRSPAGEADARVARMRAYLDGKPSLEANQPPVYYAAAGAWLALGRALGLRDGRLLYHARLLGALGAFALVGFAWWALRAVYRDDPLVRLGVPALLAVIPFDGPWYVTADALSPALGGLAFALLVRARARIDGGAALWIAAGAALALALLCRYPNAALYAAALVLLAGTPAGGARWAGFAVAALLPPLLWMARHLWLGGDALGTAPKVEALGWERNPPSAWLAHPIFTPSGAWRFVRELVPSFWRGELVWYQRQLTSPRADFVYAATTLVAIPLALWGAVRGSGRSAASRVEASAGVAVLGAAALLAFLSLLFVFHEDSHPSVYDPYLVNGRLVTGVALPFALLLVRGIGVGCAALPGRIARPAAWGVLGVVIGVALVSEVRLTLPVFASPYNFYHLP